MSNIRVARRYASALIVLTGEAKKPQAVADDLFAVQSAMAASRELRTLLTSPVISKDRKVAAFTQIFKGKIGEEALMYLVSIIEKGRGGILADVLAQYFILRDEQLGIVSVEVRSAVELTPAQQQALTEHLEGFTMRKVRVTFSLDKMLKGGFVARLGDTMVDASVRRQLDVLRAKLKEGVAAASHATGFRN